MPVATAGNVISRANERARRDVRDRLTQGPENRQDERRPRTDRGFLGDDRDDRDPVPTTRGLLAGIEETINDALAGPAQDLNVPTERQGRRPPRDEERRRLARPAPDEEEPVIIPGDPSNLGGRGRRRRAEDDRDASPVLRRGLLGV